MTAATPNRLRSIAITVFKWLLAAGLLVGLYFMCGKDLAQLQNRQILWGMFATAVFVRLLSLLATFTRWRLLVRGTGLPFSFRESFRLGMLGEACNLMGPGAVGGDLIKAALLGKDHPKRIPSVLATVFLDRVLGMWSLFMLGALASLSPAGTKPGPELQWAVWVLWGGGCGTTWHRPDVRSGIYSFTVDALANHMEIRGTHRQRTDGFDPDVPGETPNRDWRRGPGIAWAFRIFDIVLLVRRRSTKAKQFQASSITSSAYRFLKP